ncbi:hypothetical protein [Compostimonas suwonensis]|uniref:Uncharacterized protein n=1 Tax=Compostimonas suwonensis TaxID=1048394 RepID=A0A2M9C544_9MICO|nr:hypothetical protein [Compostimonas suwonensis]PJJ65619.1 hypothetical protein CLV54_0656 [Compostimonas suwonensis]
MTRSAEDVTRTRPPAELLVATVLSYIAGIAEIVLGILLIFVRYVPDIDDTGDREIVTIVGAATVLLGLFVVSLASGLTRGRRDARILLTVLFSISFVLGLVVLFADADDAWFRVVDLAITAGIVCVLWTGRVARFFARSGGARTG